MMESKRAAAPNGPQAAWPHCHRTNTKPGRRQRCTPPAASRRRPRAPAFWAVIAGEVRPKGQVRPKVGAGHRGPFLQAVSHARELFIRARDLFVDVRELFIGARDQGIAAFTCSGRGVHWRFLFPSNVIRRWWSTLPQADQPPTLRAVLPKEWPYDGKVWNPMAIASWNPGGPLRCSRAARQLSSVVGRRRMRFRGPGQVALASTPADGRLPRLERHERRTQLHSHLS